jgi:predicted amidohydrolase
MKVAIAQLITSPDKAANLVKAKEYIKKAKAMGADLVCLPETFMIDLAPGLNYADIAEPVDGPFATGLAEAARENNIWVICGMYEPEEGENVRAYNTTIVLDREGKIIHKYHKTHLYDAFAYQESKSVIPGDGPLKVFETEFGTMGLMVCYELRYPEVARQLTLQGADIIMVPTAWLSGYLKEEQFEMLVRTRAIENTVYVCACDQVGTGHAGRSLVADPMGVIVGSIGEEEGMFVADIDPDRIRRVREKNPCVAQRRTEFYTIK